MQEQERAEAAEKDAADWKRAMLNIAALLHHDGGHWMKREMTAQEVHDACVAAWGEDVKAADMRAYTAEKERDEARMLQQGAEYNEGLMRADLEAVEKALADVLNYWEPDCKSEDCDKGFHIEALHAWQRAKALLRPEGRREWLTR